VAAVENITQEILSHSHGTFQNFLQIFLGAQGLGKEIFTQINSCMLQ
jgi:hypothetical protein